MGYNRQQKMKKLLVVFLAIAGVTLFSSFKQSSVSNVNEADYETVVFASSSTYSVTCVKFSGNVTVKTTGEYDPDSETITIKGNTYTVRKNPYHGDGTKRGDYSHMAGEYFFNL